MVGGGALVVGGGSVCSDWGVLALVIDFREFMLTSPPELAHCGGGCLSGYHSGRNAIPLAKSELMTQVENLVYFGDETEVLRKTMMYMRVSKMLATIPRSSKITARILRVSKKFERTLRVSKKAERTSRNSKNADRALRVLKE